MTFISDSVWIAAMESPSGRHGFVTTDSGFQWTYLSDQPNSDSPNPAVFIDQMHARSAPEFSGKLYVTEDGGLTWKIATP